MFSRVAGLYVILDLHGAPGSQNGLDNSGFTSPDPNEIVWGETWMYSPENNGNTVRILAAMAEYINHIEDSFGLDNIMALELLNEPWAHLDLGRVRDFYVTSITAVRLVRPLMPIIIHDSFRGPMWATLMKNFPYKDIVMADLSSDTAVGDRQKIYVHERMACSYTSMLRYQTCAVLPVMVGEWSLAVDNCMPWLDSKFADFGQCDHLTEREGNSWWSEHTRSFAMRQIDRYEREMGWAFWTWKLEDHLEKNEPASKYWSFSMAVEHGFIDTDFPEDACIHPPATDWAEPLGTDGSGSGGDANLAAAQAPSGVTARVDGNAAAAVEVSNSPEEPMRGSQKGASSPGAMLGLVLLGAMAGALATFLLVRRKAASQGASASASGGAEKRGGNRGAGWMPAVFRYI
ncbi:GH5 [Ectocarpus sp. CCAP 1310/34]|nr:GH5 [Ectocarpus sp. CCAP 1310/34]